MRTRHLILATAGHVDHGKSSLVRALTGTDPDRLPEEKARGITIDLGFATCVLAGAVDEFRLGVIDVPGHEDFVKNMVAGVGAVDLALLAVAADDGWMPQTEEHLQILAGLGVKRAVVALTKADATPDLPAAIDAVRRQLAGTVLEQAPVVPTSMVTGGGLTELRRALAAVLETTPDPVDAGQPRLAVDRVFTVRGMGTVVTGTLAGGTLSRGQDVVVQPAGTPARIRTLQSHGLDLERAVPGQRVALCLPDLVRAETAAGGGTVRRGDVVTVAPLGGAGTVLDVRLERSPRLGTLGGGAAAPLRDGTRVRLHLGSGQHFARVLLRDRGPLETGGSMLAELRLESPAFCVAGERFILRDWPGTRTIGSGTVLEAGADRRRFRREPQGRYLNTLAAMLSLDPPAAERAGTFLAARLARDGWMDRRAWPPLAGVPPAAESAAIDHLVAAGTVIRAGDILIDAAWWDQLLQRALGGLDAHHRFHPDEPGWRLSDLRAALPELASPPVSGVVENLLAALGRRDCVVEGAVIRRRSHRPALPPALQLAGERIRGILAAQPFEPPSRRELAADAVSQQALRALRERGEVIEAGMDLILAAEAYARVVGVVREHLRARGTATVSELRQLLGTSRRVIVPLVERLDRDGITARRGDLRIPGPRA